MPFLPSARRVTARLLPLVGPAPPRVEGAPVLGSPSISIGDQAEMRKPHACGSNRWTVIRTGADIRIQCAKCGRAVLLPRAKFLRGVRKLEPAAGAGDAPAG